MSVGPGGLWLRVLAWDRSSTTRKVSAEMIRTDKPLYELVGNTPALRGGSKGRGCALRHWSRGRERRAFVDYSASATGTLTAVKMQSNNSPTGETA
jgi:hypothetical protein